MTTTDKCNTVNSVIQTISIKNKTMNKSPPTKINCSQLDQLIHLGSLPMIQFNDQIYIIMIHAYSIYSSILISLCSSIYILLIQADCAVPFILSIAFLFHARCIVNCFSTLSILFSPLTAILPLLLAKHLFPFNSLLRTPFSPPVKTSATNNNFSIYYIKKDFIQQKLPSVALNHKTSFCSHKKLYLTTRTPFT